MTLAFFVSILVLSFARLFTLEVERIWMFLVPFVLVAAAREIVTVGSPKPPRLALRVGVVMLVLFLQTWITEIVLYTWW